MQMGIDKTMQDSSLQANSFRLMVFLITLLAIINEPDLFAYSHFFAVSFCALILYASITIYLSDQNKFNSAKNIGLIAGDSFIAGSVIGHTSFDFTITTTISLLYGLALIGKGRRYLPISLLLFLIGCFFGYLTPHSITLTDSTTGVILVLVSIYCFIVVHLFHSRNKKLATKVEIETQTNTRLFNQSFHLSKYLSPSIRREILSGKRIMDEPQQKELTIFFSDMAGFTELAEQLNGDELTEFLNTYLTEMSGIAVRFGGTIDKIMGDSIMVFFGDPVSRGVQNDAISCVSMAIAMRKAMKKLQQRWQSAGIKEIPSLRMGINTGLCKVGNFGTEHHLNYTLLGRSVNLASRLESAACDEEILISLSTYELVKHSIDCTNRGEIAVKGFSKPVIAYSVIDMIKQEN